MHSSLAKYIVNVTMGATVVATFICSLWALLYGIGATVAYVTLPVGGDLGIWPIIQHSSPSNIDIALGFLYMTLTIAALGLAGVFFLANLGKAALSIFVKRATPNPSNHF